MIKRLPFLSLALILPLLLGFTLLFARQTLAGSPDVCATTCTYSTIQEALNDDNTVGTTLILAGETFTENVEITRSITLVGAGSGLTIIDGQLAGTVIHISGSPVVSISGLTIQRGDTTSVDGGGLLNEGGTVNLSNVIVEKNQAPNGAGITNAGAGVMVLDNVIVRNNVADEFVTDISVCEDCAGGGIFNLGVLTITNSTIHGNQAKFGAGIDNAFNSSFFADNIEVYGNTAQNNPGDPDSAGGGIENLGTMTLANSIVHNNLAPYGAGLANDGTLTVSGSNIYANIAGLRGGGLHNSFNLTVQTSNIYDNEAGSGGGGGISSESGTVLVEQTAVYSNSASGSGGGIVRLGRVGTSHNKHVQVLHLGNGVGHGAGADGKLQAGNGTSVAESGTVIDVVGANQGAHELLEDVSIFVGGFGAGVAGDGVATALLGDAHQVIRDVVERFIPGGFAPLRRGAASFFPIGTNERRLHPSWMLDIISTKAPFNTQHAIVRRGVKRRFDSVDVFILHL